MNFLLLYPGDAGGEHLIWRWVEGTAWLGPRAELGSSDSSSPGSAAQRDGRAVCRRNARPHGLGIDGNSHWGLSLESVRPGVTNLLLSFAPSGKLLSLDGSELNARGRQC